MQDTKRIHGSNKQSSGATKMNERREGAGSFVLVALVLVFVLAMLMGGSTTVPVKPKCPDPPKYGLKPCPQLLKLREDAKLSDVAGTVIYNYSTYYECAVRNDAWIEWYHVQKHIYEGVK